MLRRSIVLFTLVSLLVVVTFGFNGRVVAAPAMQATATPEHAMEDEHEEDEHGHGERIDAGGASIRIVAPADGTTVTSSSVLVQVETTDYALGDGRHFHLYVNGTERGMSQGNSDTMAANDLQPGENTIEVVLSNDQHQELDAAASITIRYEASASVAPTGGDNTTLLVVGIVGAVIVVAGAGFVVARRK